MPDRSIDRAAVNRRYYKRNRKRLLAQKKAKRIAKRSGHTERGGNE